MKKFTKICLIMVAILVGMGAILCGIASFMGASLGNLRQMANNGELNHGNWHINEQGIYYSDDELEFDLDTDIEPELEDIADKVVNEAPIQREDGGLVYTYDIADIREIDVDITAAKLFLSESAQGDKITVSLYNCKEKYYEGGIFGGTLEIEYDDTEHELHHSDDTTQIVIEIPSGMYVEELDIDMGAVDATFDMGSVTCGTLKLDVGAANVIAEEFTVTKLLDVSAGAGNVEIHGGDYQDIKVECGMGNFTMSGVLGGNLEASCGMGSMDMTFEGEESDYNYMLTCGMGELKVNGTTYSSVGGSHKVTNPGAALTIKLDCGMGSASLEIK